MGWHICFRRESSFYAMVLASCIMYLMYLFLEEPGISWGVHHVPGQAHLGEGAWRRSPCLGEEYDSRSSM